MASIDGEALEQKLVEAGNKLANTPSSFDELLPLLDRVESYLARVEQSPTMSMQRALGPIQNALITEQLLRHPDVDVRVALAACISEILRIAAPDAPYDDEHMKNVLELIVSTFDNLEDTNSRLYPKRVAVLETFYRVRACVLMLDLECDALIADMFHKFVNSVRDCHPENVVSSMEEIMTLVIQEREEVMPMETIMTPLASVKKANEPVARKMAERVIQACGPQITQCWFGAAPPSMASSPADDGFVSVPRDVDMEDSNGDYSAVQMEASSKTSLSWLGSRFQWLLR